MLRTDSWDLTLFPPFLPFLVASMRFHILGTGAIGCHIASELHRARHPVTLVLRSQNHLEQFRARQNKISYVRNKNNQKTLIDIPGEFDATVSPSNHIETLVVATKAQHAAQAIRAVQPCLNDKSTLILLQNGMGVAEELLDSVFSSSSPSIILGVNRHAVERTAPFSIQHNWGWQGPDALVLGAMPHSNPSQVATVMNQLKAIPDLAVTLVDWDELRRWQMRKLVINASINPVAAILNVKNGDLLRNADALAFSRAVCDEAARVLTELQTTGDALFSSITDMLTIAFENNCSTVQDIRAGRLTEIDYINGYLIKLANERRIDVPANRFLVQMLHAKERVLGCK